jgi:hypothetical protein
MQNSILMMIPYEDMRLQFTSQRQSFSEALLGVLKSGVTEKSGAFIVHNICWHITSFCFHYIFRI